MPAFQSSDYAQETSFTVAEGIERVRYDLMEEDSDRHTDAMICSIINEGSDEFARRVLWYQGIVLLSVSGSVSQVALPDGCLDVREVLYDDRPLHPIRVENLRFGGFNYYEVEGTPTCYYVERGTNLGLYPKPEETEAAILTVKYLGLPEHKLVSQTTGRWNILPGYERALLVYAKMLCCERDAEGAGGPRLARYAAQWEQLVNEAKFTVLELNERAGGGWGEQADLYGYRNDRVIRNSLYLGDD